MGPEKYMIISGERRYRASARGGGWSRFASGSMRNCWAVQGAAHGRDEEINATRQLERLQAGDSYMWVMCSGQAKETGSILQYARSRSRGATRVCYQATWVSDDRRL